MGVGAEEEEEEEDVSVVASAVSVLSEAVVSSVDVSSDVVSESEGPVTSAVVSDSEVVDELEVSDSVIVVTTAGMVISVVDPVPVTVATVWETSSVTSVDERVSVTIVPSLVKEIFAVLVYVKETDELAV